MQVEEAIILAGGKGSRITDITNDEYHKGLALIQNKEINYWQILWLVKNGVKHIIFALGHHSNKTIAFLDRMQSEFSDVDIEYVVEERKLGSGGAFKLATKYIRGEKCYVVNGDTMTTTSLEMLNEVHERKRALASMLLVNMTSPYGIAKVENEMIKSFIEKPRLELPIHAGVDIIEREIFDRFPDLGQMEDTIFNELVEERRFASYIIPNEIFWKSIDTPKDYIFVEKNWPGLD